MTATLPINLLLVAADVFGWLADSSLMPHGYCLRWDPALVSLHVGADTAIALSYYSIPAGLFYFVKKRDDIAYSWIFVLFGIFILACGTTHLMEIWTLWQAKYGLEAVVKVVTAVASVVTAVMLWRLLPAAIALPSPEQLRVANAQLEDANAQLEAAVAKLEEANARLEREVVERRRAEAALETTTVKLQRSNAELEHFASVASHDLQEPLRMVSSFLQLLQRRYADQLDETADEYIEYAVDGAKRMQVLIQNLLAYSRLGTRAEPFESVDTEAVVRDVADDLSVAIEEHGASLTVDDLPTVQADPTQLRQVFQNLIANALKFRGETAPAVRVSAVHTEHVLADDASAEGWRFAVADNGIGIPAEHAERIFRIFQRLHTRDEYEGTGIGLAMCKKIVERHGGRIWFESEPGAGTTFYFTLPLRPAPIQPDHADG
ncbi:MAG: ATP-binding protein [Rhodothermales bacterium]